MHLMLTNPSANAMATKTFGDGVIPHIVSYPRGVENFYVVSEKKFFLKLLPMYSSPKISYTKLQTESRYIKYFMRYTQNKNKGVKVLLSLLSLLSCYSRIR